MRGRGGGREVREGEEGKGRGERESKGGNGDYVRKETDRIE